MPPNDGTLIIEDAHILPGQFRNFTGREGQYNREGDRNFSLLLDPQTATAMKEDGWNVKQLKPRDGAEEGDFYITVSVGFKNRPPLLVLISSKGRINLSQHECDLLDWVDIKKADVIIRPYRWDVNGKSGIKAYVKSLFITMEEDYLELKYSDVPMAQLEAKDHDNNVRSIEATTQLLQIEAGGNQTPDEDEDIVDAELVE